MIIICGPTASGKTELAYKLAEKINIEIISADSRQIYKYLSVGTAKPAGKWVNDRYIAGNLPYHLVDFINPDQQFNAGEFVTRSKELINKIESEKKVPVIVGGTGLYIKSLIDGLSVLPEKNDIIRSRLQQLADKNGPKYLHDMLVRIDPVSAKKIHENNIHRLIRTIEVYELTGKPISELHKIKNKNFSDNSYIYIGLFPGKAELHERIENRIKVMLETGILEETRNIIKMGYPETCSGLQSVGYKYIIMYLKKLISYDIMLKNIITDTKHYAKRQLTWFNGDKRIIWINNISEINKVWKMC